MNTRSSYNILDEVGRPVALLPPYFRWGGGAVAIAGVAAFLGLVASGSVVLGTFVGGTTTMMGLAGTAFSREPVEDELTRKLRLESAYWAIMVGVSMLMGANTIAFFVDGQADFYNGTGLMCAVLAFYLVRFHSALRSLRTDATEA
jgi:hypothetical protein